MVTGLFTRTEIKSGAETRRTASKPKDLSAARLHELGLVGVKNMNPKAKTPNMRPSGPEDPILYFIGEGPGRDEDEEGEPFVGKSGQFLRGAVSKKWIPYIRFDNCVRTRPVTAAGKNRPPEFHELECFRPSVESDIEKAKPWAIVGFGNVPLTWAVGDVGGIKGNRGRRFPVRIGKHECWYYAVMHPSFVLRAEGDKDEDGEGSEGIPAEEWEKAFYRDVALPIAEYTRNQDDKPVFINPEDFLKKILCYEGREGDLPFILKFFEEASSAPVGLDIETNCLRPYEAGAKILTLGISTREKGVAFAWDHPQSKWSKADKKKLREALTAFLTGSNRKVVHNLSFDMEWLLHELGEEVIWSKWDDTMVQAYHIDSREGGQSLDFLCNLYFGIRLKDFSTATSAQGWFGAQLATTTSIDRAKLATTELGAVLKYNGLDAIFCMHLFDAQRAKLKQLKLLDAHNFHMKRVPMLVVAQSRGMLVNVERVNYYQKELALQIKELEARIKASSHVQQFEKLMGPYNPHSPNDFKKLLRDVVKLKEGEKEGGKYSTDKNTLAKVKDVPIVEMTLKLREIAKLKSTYADPLDPKDEKTIVNSDGRIHTIFKHTKTVTRRTSSAPNLQNFPKRRNANIRECIIAGVGNILIACDYGALEARGIAMASSDKNLVDAQWTDYDIHAEWAKRITEVYPDTYIKRGKIFKAWRSEVKNQFTFPAFYGAGVSSISRSLEMPRNLLEKVFQEFWRMFAGVKRWQDKVIKAYEENFYVETLTGFRRYGPMTSNMAYNSPIQGTGSDILVDAMTRLARRAFDEGKPWLAPVLNVHDDSTGCVPIDHAPEAAQIIVEEMTKKTFDFINVPLVVEMSIGYNWSDMHKVGDFRTDQPYDPSIFATALENLQKTAA